MRAQYLKAKARNSKLKHFTPYSQRPVDLYFRYKHSEPNLFQDETMGANIAPQASRMAYLIRHLPDLHLIETWPKLVLYHLVKPLKLSKREVLDYRHLERGVGVRTRVLERLVEKSQLFIYERDLKKLVTNMDAFDSFICAWVAMMTDLERVVEFKRTCRSSPAGSKYPNYDWLCAQKAAEIDSDAVRSHDAHVFRHEDRSGRSIR